MALQERLAELPMTRQHYRIWSMVSLGVFFEDIDCGKFRGSAPIWWSWIPASISISPLMKNRFDTRAEFLMCW